MVEKKKIPDTDKHRFTVTISLLTITFAIVTGLYAILSKYTTYHNYVFPNSIFMKIFPYAILYLLLYFLMIYFGIILIHFILSLYYYNEEPADFVKNNMADLFIFIKKGPVNFIFKNILSFSVGLFLLGLIILSSGFFQIISLIIIGISLLSIIILMIKRSKNSNFTLFECRVNKFFSKEGRPFILTIILVIIVLWCVLFFVDSSMNDINIESEKEFYGFNETINLKILSTGFGFDQINKIVLNDNHTLYDVNNNSKKEPLIITIPYEHIDVNKSKQKIIISYNFTTFPDFTFTADEIYYIPTI